MAIIDALKMLIDLSLLLMSKAILLKSEGKNSIGVFTNRCWWDRGLIDFNCNQRYTMTTTSLLILAPNARGWVVQHHCRIYFAARCDIGKGRRGMAVPFATVVELPFTVHDIDGIAIHRSDPLSVFI